MEVAETTAETPIIEPEITTEFTATEESQEEDLEKMIEDYLKLFLAEELISQEYHDKLKEMVEEGMIEKEVLFDILKKIYERHETEEKIEDFEAILDASLGIDIRTKTPFEIIEKPGIVDLAGLAEKGFILTDPRDLPEEKIDESLIIEKIEMAEIEEETGKISRIKFSGKGEPNTLLLLFVYSQPIVVSIKTDQNGYWEYQFEEELPDGEHSVYIARIDESGLIQSRSKPFRFIKEAQAIEFTPEVSMVTGSSDEGFFSIVIILLVVIILTAALLLTLLIIGSKKTPKITSDVH